jgi:hypothetical protein
MVKKTMFIQLLLESYIKIHSKILSKILKVYKRNTSIAYCGIGAVWSQGRLRKIKQVLFKLEIKFEYF